MAAKKRMSGEDEASGVVTSVVTSPSRRKTSFGRRLQDDPYRAKVQTLLRQARSKDEIEARMALLELFYRFHARLPLEEARLGRPLPWNREPSKN